jgi:hypothetical protein
MILRKFLLVKLLLIVVVGNAVCENNSMSLKSSFKIQLQCNNSGFRFIPYFDIVNTIDCKGFFKDTLELSLTRENDFQFVEGMDIEDVNVSAYNFDCKLDSLSTSIKFDKNKKSIMIIKKSKRAIDFKIRISYLFKYEMKDLFESVDNKFLNITCSSNTISWYFYHNSIEYNNMEISNSPKFHLFTNAKYKAKTQSSKLYDINNIEPIERICLTLVNSNFYKKEIININENTFNLYLLKTNEPIFDTVTNKIKLKNQFPSHHYENICKVVEKKLSKLDDFPKLESSKDIVEIIWRDTTNDVYFGRCCGRSYIRCDSRFFTSSIGGLIHEVLHIFSNVRSEKTTPGYLLFNESLIEAYAKYVTSEGKLDSTFRKMNNYFVCNYPETKNVSIFSVPENTFQFFGVVYFKTPYKIYSFARETKNHNFWTTLKSFLLESNSNVKWQDFYEYFLKHGFSEEELTKLRNSL